MKLHWSPRSPFVRKVLVIAHEAGVFGKLELVRSVVAMSAPNRDLMRENPLSKIPTLILDDGSMVCDSGVIAEYLASLNPAADLIPAAGRHRWEVLSRQAFGDGLIDLLVLYNNERNRPEPLRSSSHLSAFREKLNCTLDYLEQKAETIAPRQFDLGDAALGCALGYVDFRFSDAEWRAGRPALSAWQAGFESRPSAIATNPVDA